VPSVEFKILRRHPIHQSTVSITLSKSPISVTWAAFQLQCMSPMEQPFWNAPIKQYSQCWPIPIPKVVELVTQVRSEYPTRATFMILLSWVLRKAMLKFPPSLSKVYLCEFCSGSQVIWLCGIGFAHTKKPEYSLWWSMFMGIRNFYRYQWLTNSINKKALAEKQYSQKHPFWILIWGKIQDKWWISCWKLYAHDAMQGNQRIPGKSSGAFITRAYCW